MRTRVLSASTAVVVGLGLFPALAQAHGFAGRADPAIPRWMFAWGAFVVLVASFVGLATLWPKAKLERAPEREVWRIPGRDVLEVVAGGVGVFLFFVTVYSGLDGTQEPDRNWAPTFVFIIFWVGMPFFSALLGDGFSPVNPWRAFGRATGWVVARVRGSAPEPLPYPTQLGRWPAALMLFAFCVLELVVPDINRNPDRLAGYALAYAAIQLVGMSVYGTEAWTRHADGFAVYFNLVSRISPLDWRDGRLYLRPVLSGTTGLTREPGTVAVLVVLVGTTSFDGFSQGPTWRSIAPHLQDGFGDLGFGLTNALAWASFVGIVAMVAIIGVLFRLGLAGIRTVDTTYPAPELGRRFVHSLVPIALAYVVAHYVSYFLVNGQQIFYLVSDPLGHGKDLFGTSSYSISGNWLSNNMVWYIQVAALLVGHVGGLVLAHDRALTMYDSVRVATRSQYWMLAVMVAFTSLGLWLLSAQGT